jgi:hypothetical protein
MAEMTLDEAERTLTKARKWNSNGGLTDLQLARKLHNSLRDGGFTMAFFSLTFLKLSGHQDWDRKITWGFGLTILALSFYMVFQSSRYSKIRELFESLAPQHLENLKPRSQPEPLSEDSQ